MNDLITVIVPIYNVERYLDRCLESIVNQTYKNLEIILVDDGSPDNCPEMCDVWARHDSRIKVIHKHNEGLGVARNTGIENATGKYICFVDSDDYIATSIIEEAFKLAEKENADIVLFGMADVNCSNEIIRDFVPPIDGLVYRGNNVQEKLLPSIIYKQTKDNKCINLPFSACNALFRLSTINENNWRFVSERKIISEDSFSLLRLYSSISCVAVLPQLGYFHYINIDSLTHKFRIDRFERLKIFYFEAINLCDNLKYNETVKTQVTKLFLSFTVDMFKQTVNCRESFREKISIIETIVNDGMLQNTLSKTKTKDFNVKLRLLFFAVRARLSMLVYLLAKLQTILVN